MIGILADELRLQVIRPTLKDLELWSEAAENLLLGTAAHESHMGHYLSQQQGEALGIYQIEPATHEDVWENYLNFHPNLAIRVSAFASKRSETIGLERDLITNLAYATAITRIIYLRSNESLPDATDLTGLARYWKKHFNTEKGKGKIEDFINNYTQFIQK